MKDTFKYKCLSDFCQATVALQVPDRPNRWQVNDGFSVTTVYDCSTAFEAKEAAYDELRWKYEQRDLGLTE